MSPDQPAGSLAPGYRLVGRVWRGADATSYRAVRESDQRDVLLTVAVSQPAMVDVLERMLRMPRMPQLAELLAEGRTEAGLPFLAIAYFPDPSYEEHAAESGPLPADEVVRVGIAVAEGLDALHRAGIGHGAVTAANILRRPDGPLLTGYAPWSAATGPPDVGADLADLAAAMRRLLGEDPPAWLQAVLARATSPAGRFPDAAGFVAALQAGLATPDPAAPAPAAPAPAAPAPAEPGPAEPGPAEPGPAEAGPAEAGPAEPEPAEPEPAQSGVAAAGAVAAGGERRRAARSWVEVRPRPDSGSGQPLPPAPTPAGEAPAPEAATPAWLADLEATLDGLPTVDHPPVRASRAGAGQPRSGRPGSRAVRFGWYAVGCLAAFAVGLIVTYAVTRGSSAESADPDPPVAQPETAAPASPQPASPTPVPASPEPPPGGSAPPVPAVVPVDVVVTTDERVAVTLSWRNQADGEVPLTVIGGPVGTDPEVLGSAAAGDTSLRINGLNPQLEYCFRIVAASSVDDDGVEISDQVCTARD